MIGSTISHYKILEKLGEGGMGIVYKAQDLSLDRFVALKFLPERLKPSEQDTTRFIQEAKAAAALNHPNICTIHSIESHEGRHFIVMEYIDGVTLREKIEQKPLRLDDAVSYGLQIGDALQEAHGKGIVHRDIKADNIMVNTKNQIKVMDFGLAKLKGSLKLTRTSSTVGTLAYMAPEQIQGGEVDARSDIFSLGVVLYEMLTGHMPFAGEHEAAMMYSILNEEPVPLLKHVPDAPGELLHILGRALEKDPEDRYQNVHEMLIDLRRLRKESTKISRRSLQHMPEPPQPRMEEPTAPVPQSSAPTAKIPALATGPNKRFVLVGAAVLALAVVGIIGYFLIGTEEEIGERIPVAVADFINQTKEEELDGLSGMLITSLEQSRRLAVVTRSRMFDVLKQMGKGNVDRIDESLGREICQRTNVNALVIASVQKFDQLYIIDLKVLDPIKNEYLLTAKEQAEGKASIPAMIDKLSEKTRVGLKEQTTEVQSAKQKVAEMTTTNIEAYQHYFLGEQLINKLQFTEATEQFRKAVAIDSTFAIAHYRLSYALQWNSSPGADEAIGKAMQYIDKVPEKERYYIRGEDAMVRRNVQLGLSIYKQLVDRYPEEKEAAYLVGDYSFHQADYPTAIMYLRRVIGMDPTFERAYQHLCWTYRALSQHGDFLSTARQYVAKTPNAASYDLLAEAYVAMAKFDSAMHVIRRGLEIVPGSAILIESLGHVYLFQHKFDLADAEYRKLIHPSRSASDQRMGHWGLAVSAIYQGKYKDAFRFTDKTLELNLKENDRGELAEIFARRALWQISFLGDREKAHSELAKAFEYREAGDMDFYIPLFTAYTFLREYDKAQEIGNSKLSVTFPVLNEFVEGYANLQGGNFGLAIKNFRAMEPMSATENRELYALAQCYSATEQLDSALAVLQRIQRNYGTQFAAPIFRAEVEGKSLYLMGKVYERKGEKRLAIEHYQKMLSLWKNADKDIPELIDGKSRLAMLKQVAGK